LAASGSFLAARNAPAKTGYPLSINRNVSIRSSADKPIAKGLVGVLMRTELGLKYSAAELEEYIKAMKPSAALTIQSVQRLTLSYGAAPSVMHGRAFRVLPPLAEHEGRLSLLSV
jgi:hypothetical protein